MRNLHDVIVRPLVTEKSTAQLERTGSYSFMVAKDANKVEIARAIEHLDGQLRTGSQALLHLRHPVLRNRELHIQRRQLGDDRDAFGIAGPGADDDSSGASALLAFDGMEEEKLLADYLMGKSREEKKLYANVVYFIADNIGRLDYRETILNEGLMTQESIRDYGIYAIREDNMPDLKYLLDHPKTKIDDELIDRLLETAELYKDQEVTDYLREKKAHKAPDLSWQEGRGGFSKAASAGKSR